jgi:hypothetical protein
VPEETPAWKKLMDGALAQLEEDDSIHPHHTDFLAEALWEIRASGRSMEGLRKLVSLYDQVSHQIAARRWARTAENLQVEHFKNALWTDFLTALRAAKSGRLAIVAQWLDVVQSQLLEEWERYESEHILDEEITSETVLGHQYLLGGTEQWLEVVEEFRVLLHEKMDTSGLFAKAVSAQRLLLTVQAQQSEMSDPTESFMRSWVN